MAFTASDIYLTSGLASLTNSWTENVTKFNTSSMYNWEQDNLPLYDLDERTNYLWEKLGYPIQNGSSGIPGMMFAVSADAPFAGESSGIVFKTVSSLINSLPEVITIPIIIEVASFGNLGELNLQNLKFKKNGGLEIINRNFTPIMGLASDGNISRIRSNTLNLSSIDAFNTLKQTSCLCISSLVISSYPNVSADTRFESNNILYFNRAQAYGTATTLVTGPCSSILAIGCNSSLGSVPFIEGFNGGTANSFYFRVGAADAGYDANSDYTISAYDFLSYNELTQGYMTDVNGAGSTTARRTTLATTTATSPHMSGLLFMNWFSAIKVYNCTGPIYIRGFAVDGGTGRATTLQHITENGYDIENSKVVLENALAIRCKQTGFRIVNSDVTLNRRIIAMRNYTLDNYYTRNSYKSAGLRAINSNLIVSSNSYASGVESLFHFTKNYYGLELFNTRMIGGTSRKSVGNVSGITFVQTFFNNIGFKADGSYVEIPGRLDTYTNDIGLNCVNSQILLNEGTFEYNQSYGIKAESSYIRYNQDLYPFSTNGTYATYGQLHFRRNGINFLLDKSNLTYTDGSGLPDVYGAFYVDKSVGTANDTGVRVSLPNLQVFNGSQAKIIGVYLDNNQTGAGAVLTNPGVAGLLATAKNNSKITFTGTKNKANVFIGPNLYSLQKHIAALGAANASIIEIQGPSLICNTGVGALAEDGSIIKIGPPRDDFGNLLTTQFNLSSNQNHTKVEIHATRACLVANNQSLIVMEDLGAVNSYWPTSQLSAIDYNYADEFGIASSVSGGYMQFYPNGQESDIITASAGRYNIETYSSFTASPVLTNNYLLIDWANATAPAEILKISTGGMCVRALNGSKVKVKNVHFPTGWDNTSGILYDASSGNCNMLRIWNIGPDSQLEASYCIVSGVYPSLAGYYGPSAVYLSGTSPASAVPSWVPDTGVLSVLDSYGASGSTAGTNYGPFRIYVSVDGPSKFLNYYTSAGLYYNAAYQAWAQGYNPSGPLSAAPAVSSYYQDLTTSVFKTTSAMVDPGFRDRIRLDQSAADMFANAKNGALAKSGRVPICTIYRSSTDTGSEGFDTSAGGYGIGLLSVNTFDLNRNN